MFRPMAITVVLALGAATVLSMTFIPCHGGRGAQGPNPGA
jgi:Cu/Ag efflux pump CusA